MESTKFKYASGEPVKVTRTAYKNDVPALVGHTPDGEEYAVFSVNVPDQAHLLKPNQTFIKNYSEGAGNLEVLQEMGAVGPVLFEVPTGFVRVPAVEVLIPAPAK